MQVLNSSDLRAVLHSKRANLYYLEHCRLLVNGGRVVYVTDEGSRSLYWNIPIANTTTILLGNGTSLTQAAMRELAKAGVMVGFCGGGGTPLFAAVEREMEVAWVSPQSEYRPTEYLQHWVRFWFNDTLRLEAAKELQLARVQRVLDVWTERSRARDGHFGVDISSLQQVLATSRAAITTAINSVDLLTTEARLTKQLYRLAANATSYGGFVRAKRGENTDIANGLLDHGNYLAYGLGATATWVLGLPHGLAVLHGKTRRGGLVFDAADLIKDAVVLPNAFICAMRGDSETEFRRACIDALTRTESLDFMIDTLKTTAQNMSARVMTSQAAVPADEP